MGALKYKRKQPPKVNVMRDETVLKAKAEE
jgi:hypothetical protein